MKLRSLLTAGAAVMLLGCPGLVFSGTEMSMERDQFVLKVASADTSSEAKPGPSVPSSNPLSGDPEAIAAGNQLFFTWCAQCHGTNASGGKYGANLTLFGWGYKEFLVIVKNGRAQKQMPPWKGVLDEDAISRIGAYLETLAQPGANWR